jgi:pimeloyl-[acyl-carrier protein] methyl ester esterase
VQNPGVLKETEHRGVQVIAMHGWAGDSRCWKPWIEATENLGWRWQCGERGYGEIKPHAPAWPEDLPAHALRVVIGHSLGPHLVRPEVLQAADAVVLLASFAAFVPPDRAGRRLRMALEGMAAKLDNETEAKEMLEKFLANAAYPARANLLPAGPEEGRLDRRRLRADLDLLRECQGLPRGLPVAARVLVVEAGDDRIVVPEARLMLRSALPDAEVALLDHTGHALLQTGVIARVIEWVESLR